MAIIAPFMGLTYNFERFEDISRLMVPPYDVITREEQDEYYDSEQYNIIRLILGKKKMGDSDWDNQYTRSADYLKRWQLNNILIRSHHPSMYVTSHTYDPNDGGGSRVRWGLIAVVRIEDEGSGVILPHERTFSAHRDDRLKLMRATNAQFSQIFCLFNDPENKVFGFLRDAVVVPPRISFGFKDGTGHKMWTIEDRNIFKKVADAMSDKSIFIADGHHRYETARNFRNIMRARYGSRPPNRSYEYVMVYLSNMDDRGLAVLPSHRLIKRTKGFRLDSFLERLKQWFEVEELPFSEAERTSSCRSLKQSLEEKGRKNVTIGFHYHGGKKCYLLSMREGAEAEMGDDLHPSLKQLDVLILSRLILQKSLDFTREELDDESIFHYDSSLANTISMVDDGAYEMAFLLNPTKIDHVKEVAGNGLIMPRKSTYFFPKVLTGLVFNMIDPHEIIQTP